MKKAMTLLTGFLASALVWTLFAADIILDGVTPYDVATGMTMNENNRLTGSGSIRKTGKGTLALMNGGNDFTGGIDVQDGVVETHAQGSLGRGDVTLANNVSQLFFKAPPSVPGAFVAFTNNIEVTGTGTAVDATRSIFFYTNTAIHGNITAARSVLMRHEWISSSPGKGGASATIYGSITAPNRVTFNAYGTFAIHGPITTPLCFGGNSYSGTGTVELWDPDNAIDHYVISHDILSFHATNAMRGLVEWRPCYDGNASANYSNVKLNGYPQTIKGIHFYKSGNWVPGFGWYTARYKAGVDSFAFMSTAPVTLTLTGIAGTTCESYAKLKDEVSLDVNAVGVPGFVQQFRYYTNPTTGSIAVNAGMLQILEQATFPNVPSVVVGEAGTLALENTTNTFASITNLVVNGTLTVDSSALTPFPSTMTSLVISPDAVLDLPVGLTFKTTELTLRGVKRAGGVYPLGNDAHAIIVDDLWNGAALTVADGQTFTISDGAMFPYVPAVSVAAGGVLTVAQTTNTFAAVTNVVLNGTLAVGEDVEVLFPMTLTDLTLGANASVTSPAGKPAVVYTRRLTVDGDVKELGEYNFGGLTVFVIDGIHLSGACTLDVPANTTNVLSGLVWGEGSIRKTGPGVLSFTGSDNTFTGGLTVASGTIIVAATNALGTGPVTLLPTGTQTCQIRFVANAAIANEILHDGTSTDTYPAFYFEKDVTSLLQGTVTSTGDLFVWNERKVGGGTFPAPGPVTTFEGTVNVPNHRIMLRTYGDTHFKEAITTKRFGAADVGRWSEGGRLYLYSPSNSIDTIHGFSPHIYCMATNVLGGRFVLASQDWSNGGSCLEMSGFDQSISSLVTISTTYDKLRGTLQRINGSAGTTLTLTGEAATNRTYAFLAGGVSLLVDAQDFRDSFVQRLYGRTHTTTGDLIVSNGTLEITGPAVFTKVSRVVVGAGGTLKLDSTATDALAAVTDLVVAGTLTVGDQKAFGSELTAVTVTGTLKVNADGLPFAEKTELMVGGDWLLDIPENTTLRVHALRDVETGSYYGGGVYGSAESGAPRQDLASHFSGKGTLEVPRTGTLLLFK